MSSIGDTIVAPDFEEYSTCYVENSNGILIVVLYQSEVHLFNILLQEISEQPKMRSPNELMTIQEFVKNLSRLHDCERDKVTVPDDISEYLKMQEPPEYRFPWGFWDIIVGRIFWLMLARLDKAKECWL
ncbi:hypothetical protein Tco_0622810 [Tanacetum coccineum]